MNDWVVLCVTKEAGGEPIHRIYPIGDARPRIWSWNRALTYAELEAEAESIFDDEASARWR